MIGKGSSVKRKLYLKHLKKSLTSNVKKVEIKIHSIRLTGPYTGRELEAKLGKLKYVMDSEPKWQLPLYKTKAYRQLKLRKLSISLNPKEGFLPQCILETSYPSHTFLMQLNKFFPHLQIARVEYTIDIFFKDNIDIRKYFRLLRRYLYFPYQPRCKLYPASGLNDKTVNATFQAGNMKLYERGPDEKRQQPAGWKYVDVDRIRLEYTALRYALRKVGIEKLSEFVINSKFYSIVKKKFEFKKFKRSAAQLPKEWDDYSAEDDTGFSGAFQSEYLQGSYVYENVQQCLEDVKELEPFYRWLLLRMAIFNDNWTSRYTRKYGPYETWAENEVKWL